MGVLLFHLCKLKQAYPFCGATPLHPKKNGDAELFLLPEDALQRGPWRGAEL